jgi:hypothetical protein
MQRPHRLAALMRSPARARPPLARRRAPRAPRPAAAAAPSGAQPQPRAPRLRAAAAPPPTLVPPKTPPGSRQLLRHGQAPPQARRLCARCRARSALLRPRAPGCSAPSAAPVARQAPLRGDAHPRCLAASSPRDAYPPLEAPAPARPRRRRLLRAAARRSPGRLVARGRWQPRRRNCTHRRRSSSARPRTPARRRFRGRCLEQGRARARLRPRPQNKTRHVGPAPGQSAACAPTGSRRARLARARRCARARRQALRAALTLSHALPPE